MGTRTGREVVGSGLRTAVAMGSIITAELLALWAARAQWQAVNAPGPASLDEAVELVVLAAVALVGGWLVVGTTVALLAHVPGRVGATAERWTRAWAPAAVRKVVAVLVGAAVGGGLAPGTAMGGGATPPALPGVSVTASPPGIAAPGPEFALTRSLPAPVTAPVTAGLTAPPGAPGPGWTPSRPVQRPQAGSGLVTRGSAPRTAEVVVHRGDTLWTIVRRHLGPDVSDAEVAAAWPAWHEANRAVIGPDPDLILPGQILSAPDRTASTGHQAGAR